MPEQLDKVVDDRWADLADAQSIDGPLDDAELAFLREHAEDASERARETALLRALAELGKPLDPRREDAAIADAVLAELRDEASPRRTGAADVVVFPRRTVALAATGLAAAASLALWLRPASEDADASNGLATAPVLAAPSVAVPDGPRLRAGTLAHDAGVLAVGDRVPTGVWLTGTSAESCIDAAVCADQGAQLQIADDEHGARRVELRRGSLRVDGHFGPLDVVTFQGVVASDGGRFTVDVHEAQVVVIVLVGPVTVSNDSGVKELASGARLALGELAAAEPVPANAATSATPAAARPAAPSDAADMLARAQALRGAGQHRRAATAYQLLLDRHPESPEAHAAAVTLGKLQLELGQAKSALAAFDRYLVRGGALAEEASYGRIRALDRLGRAEARDQAITAFVAEHPQSVYAAKAQALCD